jgi:hypothetical protein
MSFRAQLTIGAAIIVALFVLSLVKCAPAHTEYVDQKTATCALILGAARTATDSVLALGTAVAGNSTTCAEFMVAAPEVP